MSVQDDPFLSWLYAKKSDDPDEAPDLFNEALSLETSRVNSGAARVGVLLQRPAESRSAKQSDEMRVVGHPSIGNRKAKQELVLLACRSGMSIRKTAEFAGVCQNTAKKWLNKYRGAALCHCGRPSGHMGWCSHRLANSPARQAVIKRLHELQRDPEVMRKRKIGCSSVECRSKKSISSRMAWANESLRKRQSEGRSRSGSNGHVRWSDRGYEKKQSDGSWLPVPRKKSFLSLGLCRDCGAPKSDGKTRCGGCLVKLAVRTAKSRARRTHALQSDAVRRVSFSSSRTAAAAAPPSHPRLAATPEQAPPSRAARRPRRGLHSSVSSPA